ncbi:uncharacterized protein BX663DRAFT_190043 [Cokeromyces recurvatus]|uniref:uncharacterized protein n=1 Tax=Cokeromyces recurvatus TaxID=90255 RepID=UPI002220CE25|nr:uncharacterized protein BX663DRAFT_190043 [Cokeromyces recurvatus]KAI7906350.1 hypothetical protein BX663DRAFT_190043 [Cokeromyces recurvatus]
MILLHPLGIIININLLHGLALFSLPLSLSPSLPLSLSFSLLFLSFSLPLSFFFFFIFYNDFKFNQNNYRKPLQIINNVYCFKKFHNFFFFFGIHNNL